MISPLRVRLFLTPGFVTSTKLLDHILKNIKNFYSISQHFNESEVDSQSIYFFAKLACCAFYTEDCLRGEITSLREDSICLNDIILDMFFTEDREESHYGGQIMASPALKGVSGDQKKLLILAAILSLLGVTVSELRVEGSFFRARVTKLLDDKIFDPYKKIARLKCSEEIEKKYPKLLIMLKIIMINEVFFLDKGMPGIGLDIKDFLRGQDDFQKISNEKQLVDFIAKNILLRLTYTYTGDSNILLECENELGQVQEKLLSSPVPPKLKRSFMQNINTYLILSIIICLIDFDPLLLTYYVDAAMWFAVAITLTAKLVMQYVAIFQTNYTYWHSENYHHQRKNQNFFSRLYDQFTFAVWQIRDTYYAGMFVGSPLTHQYMPIGENIFNAIFSSRALFLDCIAIIVSVSLALNYSVLELPNFLFYCVLATPVFLVNFANYCLTYTPVEIKHVPCAKSGVSTAIKPDFSGNLKDTSDHLTMDRNQTPGLPPR